MSGKLADHIFDARQIVLGGLEPQFGFMAARVQSGNIRRLLENAAALVGARLNDFADAALVHQCRRARAGGGVGEQYGDVACSDLAAVDAKHRALLAHDAAGDFKRIGIVEGCRRGAITVVDQNRNLGVIARWTAGVAGENYIVHLGRAHSLMRGFTHDPAHGFDEIGLAAAVRTDHAGQSRFNLEVCGFDEGLEADQAQPRELHSHFKSFLLSRCGRKGNH